MNKSLVLCSLIFGLILYSCSSSDEGDTIAPQVSIISPISGTEASGIIIVQVLATDNVEVERVNFLVDGGLEETKTLAPYDFEWDTEPFADGQTHELVAIAIDPSGNQSISPSVSVTVPEPIITINISNNLSLSIEISINQSSTEEINAGASSTFIIDPVPNVRVDWELIPLLVGTDPIGDPMSGFWDIDDPDDEIDLEVDNVVGQGSNATIFFNPIITNESSSRLLMGVNWDLQAENRCNCVVPAFSDNVNLGYYLLFSNTQVRAYDEDNGYDAGGFIFWDYSGNEADDGCCFEDNVEEGSGSVNLLNSTNLTNIGIGGSANPKNTRTSNPNSGLADQPTADSW